MVLISWVPDVAALTFLMEEGLVRCLHISCRMAEVKVVIVYDGLNSNGLRAKTGSLLSVWPSRH